MHPLLTFIAGLLTFIAPCTLPILPAFLSFTAQPSKSGRILRTLAFGVGLTTVFLIYGLLAGSLGELLAMHKILIARTTGLLLILFGSMLLIGKELPGLRFSQKFSQTGSGALIFGAVFALSWTGCIGPVLGAALVLAANTQTAIQGGLLLVTYAAGLLLPLFVLAFGMDHLPREGKFWKLLRGKMLHIGKWEIHSTVLISGGMLVLLGVIFLFGIDGWLKTSPMIGWIFAIEERIAAWFGTPLG